MDNLLNVSPGLMIWTIIIFLIFFTLITKFAAKPIANALKSREDSINNAIESARNANEKAQKRLMETEDRLDNAQQEMSEIIANGRKQAELQLKKATEEAEKIKRIKVEEAANEIERQKNAAIGQLRQEVASLVIDVTEKILEEKLDKEKDYKLVESYIQKLPKN